VLEFLERRTFSQSTPTGERRSSPKTPLKNYSATSSVSASNNAHLNSLPSFLLPDHLHAIFALPSGDTDYSARIGWIKKEFTSRWLNSGGTETLISKGRKSERRRGVWQPRFWEHTIRDEEDFDRHFDYIHSNPVKHGYASAPRDWQWSSFHRWVAAGVYDEMWGAGSNLTFAEISDSVGE
jgi:REP element-mobilizing transposase RayT